MSLQTRVISHHLSSSQPDTAQVLSFEMIPLSLIPWSANLFVMILNLRNNINIGLYTLKREITKKNEMVLRVDKAV